MTLTPHRKSVLDDEPELSPLAKWCAVIGLMGLIALFVWAKWG